MRSEDKLDQLLDPVLQDEAMKVFRESLRFECHRALAHKRRTHLPWWTVPLAAGILLCLFLWPEGREPAVPSVSFQSYAVSTVSLSPGMQVHTPADLERKHGVRTQSHRDLMIDVTYPVAQVITQDDFTVERITDEEMLAIFEGVPCGLIQRGDRKVLVFPRPEDEERFFKDLDG